MFTETPTSMNILAAIRQSLAAFKKNGIPHLDRSTIARRYMNRISRLFSARERVKVLASGTQLLETCEGKGAMGAIFPRPQTTHPHEEPQPGHQCPGTHLRAGNNLLIRYMYRRAMVERSRSRVPFFFKAVRLGRLMAAKIFIDVGIFVNMRN